MIVETNLTDLVVRPDASVREALSRMNATPHLIQLVTDTEGRLVGLVTDGDIRRGFVNGANLESPIRECMHIDPITATCVEEAITIISDLSGRRRCVPVIDESGKLIQIVSDSPQTAGLDTALIMAGGFGTRLGEKTHKTPKPLLPVAGRPILWHLVKDLEEHGIQRILLSVHYLSDQFKTFIDNNKFKIDIDVLNESEPLGTAGALGLLPTDINVPLIVMNGDIITRTDYGAMMAYHQLHERDATIGASRYDIEIPFGVLDTDDDGNVSGIREKPRYEHFVSAGIYIVEPTVYKDVVANQHLDMPNLLSSAIEKKRKVGLFPIHEYWLDLGRPDDLELAEEESIRWLNSKAHSEPRE